jgi:peptidylprolyl isomerase
MYQIENGDIVTVHYTGTLNNGDVFDNSLEDGREPMTITIGEGMLIPGFESALIGMVESETKTISISSDEAYGDRDETFVMNVPMDRLPEGVEVGTTLQIMTPEGPAFANVIAMNEDNTTATVDHNHPLAGENLNFYIQIVKVERSAEVINN